MRPTRSTSKRGRCTPSNWPRRWASTSTRRACSDRSQHPSARGTAGRRHRARRAWLELLQALEFMVAHVPMPEVFLAERDRSLHRHARPGSVHPDREAGNRAQCELTRAGDSARNSRSRLRRLVLDSGCCRWWCSRRRSGTGAYNEPGLPSAVASEAAMRRTKIVATIGPCLARPRDAHAHGRGRPRRRPPELLARQPRDPRRERRARSAARPPRSAARSRSSRTCPVRRSASAGSRTTSSSSSPARSSC